MDIQKLHDNQLKELGDDPIQKSLNKHRSDLERVSNQSLTQIEHSLPEATVDQAVKVYDVTRKHLNTLDGRADTSQQLIVVIPGELAVHHDLQGEIDQQLKEKKTKQLKDKRLKEEAITIEPIKETSSKT